MSGLTIKSVFSSGNFHIPIVGLGTWQSDDDSGEKAVEIALDSGYRHIDTAFVYNTEVIIGKALNKYFATGKCKREDVCLVTKLPPSCNRPNFVEPYLKKSLENLQTDFVDLYLIHWPIGFKAKDNDLSTSSVGSWSDMELDLESDFIGVWKEMEKQVSAGRAKAIGLSNFNINQIKRILGVATVRPTNLQIEMHLYFQQRELLEFCKENNITVCAYAPLASPGLKTFTDTVGISMDKAPCLDPMTEPEVINIALKYNKLPSQVLLRFIIQLGAAVIPKSTNENRIKANIELFDFCLTEEEMNVLKNLDKGSGARLFANEFLKGIEKHPEYPF